MVAGFKADRKGNLCTGASTEDTPALVEATAFHDVVNTQRTTNAFLKGCKAR
ncbi:malonate decarboxylase subunit alpha [Serratia symbiotica]|nr:malonate decarboxylase subunit alpha [Serratia symbiotica]USS96855.1 malonate decarboxylase subunit alpha [Serratia symbiotica]